MTKTLHVMPVVCALAFTVAGCSYQKSSPTEPDAPVVETSGPATPTGDPTPSANRAADPADGERLPLPDMSHVVHQIAAQYPGALRASCQDHGGSWEFMDRLVDELRNHDTRWGYNWKRGNVGDASQDVVDYHWSGGQDENSTDVYIVDVIIGHCGDNPTAGWGDVTNATYGNGAIGRWTGRGRF